MPISAASPSLCLSSSSSSSSSLWWCSSSSLFLLASPLRTQRKSPLPSSRPCKGAALRVVRSELATLPVLSFSGEKVGEAALELRSAPPDTARAVVHRALVTDRQNRRRGTASTLTRAEVRGGGRKPYPQKKTGRARLGSQRTPLRPGGGVVFGPKPRDWSIKINRKEKRLAISTALASAAAAADALVVEDFEDQFAGGPKTKDFVAAMRRWGLDPKQKAAFLVTDVSDNVRLSSRNIGTLKMLTPRTLNLFDILDAHKLVFTRSALDYLNSMYGEDAADADLGDEEYDDDDDNEEELLLLEGRDQVDAGDGSS
ncbi:50S ribosomal protein L4, chloroplastic [Ananas comosus]|uniref:Large ribosomal subunit protein uL4c n=1 Tax=Ananas comosus TaxID=4615 RepID=A0A6P5GQJ0_ANACO|nr:50S ribosomal protein L4, chloroplastic [Ananas comosus]